MTAHCRNTAACKIELHGQPCTCSCRDCRSIRAMDRLGAAMASETGTAPSVVRLVPRLRVIQGGRA